MKISRIGEFGLIEYLRKFLAARRKGKRDFIGIGDDTAVIKISHRKYLLWTTDVLIEGIHFLPLSFFRRSTLDARRTFPFMLGWKSLAINLSDIAAMGGVPKYALVTLGLRGNEDVKFIDDLYRGMTACSGRVYSACSGRVCSAIKILGGDTSKSPILMINISVLGEVKKENLLLRKGARPGDVICVTGFCGDSAAGFELFKNDARRTTHDARHLIRKHLMPTPRVREARLIAKSGFATSMIDNSDGLLASVNFICVASKVGAKIYEEKVPVSPQLKKCSGRVYSAIQNLSLTGGEDYELVFTAKKNCVDSLKKLKTGVPITPIGEIVEYSEGLKVIGTNGSIKKTKKIGYEHFM